MPCAALANDNNIILWGQSILPTGKLACQNHSVGSGHFAVTVQICSGWVGDGDGIATVVLLQKSQIGGTCETVAVHVPGHDDRAGIHHGAVHGQTNHTTGADQSGIGQGSAGCGGQGDVGVVELFSERGYCSAGRNVCDGGIGDDVRGGRFWDETISIWDKRSGVVAVPRRRSPTGFAFDIVDREGEWVLEKGL